MTSSPPDLCGWSRRRFWGVTGFFLLAQVGLILLFARADQKPAGHASRPGEFHLVNEPLTSEQISKAFFAIDPTVFPMPTVHGFSHGAWLKPAAQTFDAPGDVETPAWLAIKATQLGTNFPSVNTHSSPPFNSARESGSELEPWPVLSTQNAVRTNSTLEVRGGLSSRLLKPMNDLPSWPSSQVLRKSFVEIAVNSAGQVIAARLLGPGQRSGLNDADAAALGRARALRFKPVPSAATVWGTIDFDWQTLEQTNAKPAVLQ